MEALFVGKEDFFPEIEIENISCWDLDSSFRPYIASRKAIFVNIENEGD